MLILSRLFSPSSSAKGSTSNAYRRSRWALLAKPAFSCALAVGVITAGQAQALVVNVNGQDWDVTTFTGTYNAYTYKFATAANCGVMPWWGNGTTAAQFAIAVDASLGTTNTLDGSSDPPAGTGAGPYFGYETSGINNIMYGFGWVSNYGVGQGVIGFPSGVTSRTWAQATLFLSTAEVPGPLPALGAAAAFGFSRKLRKRIKRSPNAVSSTYSL